MSTRPDEGPASGGGPPVPPPLPVSSNMLWNSAGSLTYFGCQWLITVLVVRLSDDYAAAGVLALAMSVYNIFAPFAVYRMYTYQVSDIDRENSVGEYLSFRFVTCFLALVACVIYAVLTCPPGTVFAISLFALTKVFSQLIDVLHGNDQLNGRMDYIGQSLMAQGVLTLGVFVGVFGYFGSLELALGGMALVTALIGFIFDLPRSRRFGPIGVGISFGKVVHLLRYCFPIVVAGVACAAAPSIPRQFLSYVYGESDLGIYASVAAPLAVIQMSASYIYNPLLTVFSRAFLADRKPELNRLLAKVLLGIAIVGVSSAILLEFVGPWLLELLFGTSIVPHLYLMQPIIVLAILSGYVWFFSDLLVVVRSFRGAVIGNLSAVLVALPASWFFVREWGMNGVSFAGIAAYGVAGVLMAGFIVGAFRKGPGSRLMSPPELT